MMQMRTHTCGELRLTDAGKHVKIVGWMENVRVVGQNFAFVVLRDFYGTTQVVVESQEMMDVINSLNKESTISVEGTVRERASKNPKQATGDVEVLPERIEVLGRCRYNSLPFEINRSREADETQRLKYRYLDLRNPAVKSNIILRCQVVSALRAAMTDHGFLEITTPILTASSPEGARDYLVPARKHPGKFYALPQAPQQFKQLLMTAGFDRYFQIAPCFRDEDARGDRSPGEFYQLDMEMAFATQEDVFAVLEDVLPPIFAKFGTYNVASSAPFRRIAYRDAMETYGSDKPDLRIDLTCKNVTSLFTESEFDALRGQTVKMVPVSNCKLTRKQIDKLLADCEVQAIRLGGGSASIINGSDLDHLLRLIRSCYHVAEDAPVTMRTCPADINGANMPFYNRSHFTRYDLELYSLEPLDFCTLDTLNYSEQMPYITHGFLRADRRDSMGFVLLYGKKTVSRWGFRHSVLEVTRRPVCHVLLQRCAGADMLDDAEAQAQLDEAAQLLTEAGFVQYLPRRWAKPGCEDKFWQGAANGMDVLAFGLSAYTRLDGMITTNTSDLNTYLAHSADYEQITVSTVPVQTAE